ncbi:MAG: LLM class flavin-dependent oxidoreductase [Akkermansiaceae bacterium]|nr:LLM class flavin-dependent oxidoreductase [Akkermansiaceae bacterium]
MKPKSLQDIPLSVLDLSPVIEGGSIAQSFRDSVSLAQHVEKLGYNRFWLAEHHNMPGIASAATSVLVGHVAGQTSTIRVGSGGVMLPNHSPLIIAEHYGTLAELYPDRIDLGLGRAPGTDRATAHAIGRDPNSADEFPQEVQQLIHYLGDPIPGQKVKAVPGMGTKVPVWLLGSSTFSAQLAAYLGLPFAFAAHFAPKLLHEALRLYRANFQPSERWPEPYAMVGVPVIAAPTDEEAAFLSTSSQQMILNIVRNQRSMVPPPVETMEGKWSLSEQAEVRQFFGAAIIGGPESVKSQLEEFVAATGADELIIHSQFHRHEDRLRSYEIVKDCGGRTLLSSGGIGES